MKPHHTVLSILACGLMATSAAYAADVTWESGNFIFSDTNTIDTLIPSDTETIYKTGTGTYLISMDSASEDTTTIASTASTFSGDVYINQGTLQLGKDGTGGLYGAMYVSPDVFGTTGTIHVASGATLKLSMSQSGLATFNKSLELNGGTLHGNDGNYTFNNVSVTAESSVMNSWGKSITLHNLSAAGQTINASGQNEVSAAYVNISGASVLGTLNINSGNSQIIGDGPGGGLTTIERVNVANGSTLRIGGGNFSHSNIKVDIGEINLGEGSRLAVDCGAGGGNNVGRTGGTVNISGNAIFAGGVYGNTTFLNDIKGAGSLKFTQSMTGYYNNVFFTGTISDNGGTLALKHESGEHTLSGENTYSGETTITGGTLNVGHANALGTGAVVMEGGTLNLNSNALVNSAMTLRSGTVSGIAWDKMLIGGVAGAYLMPQVEVNGTLTLSNSTSYLAKHGSDSVMISTGNKLILQNTYALMESANFGLSNFTDALIDVQTGSTLSLYQPLHIILNDGLMFDANEQVINLFDVTDGTIDLTNNENWQDAITMSQNGQEINWDAITFNNITGDLTITGMYLIPEPSTATLSLLGLSALLMRRRRRNG